jgi:hypothetical protein
VPVRYEAGAQNFFSGIEASRSIDSHCHQLIKYAYLAPNSPSPDHMRTLGRSSVNIFSYMWVPHLFCRHRYVVGSVPIFSLRASLVRCQYFYFLGIDHAVEGLRTSPSVIPIHLPIAQLGHRRVYGLSAASLIGGQRFLEPNKTISTPTPVPRRQSRLGVPTPHVMPDLTMRPLLAAIEMTVNVI